MTENGEKPDFMFPGCTQYHDAEFDSDHLRMVGCKSTLKDRWRQVLHEARRIEAKYVLTLDRRITAPVMASMLAAHLRVYMPSQVFERYAERPFRDELHSVAELVADLEAAAGP